MNLPRRSMRTASRMIDGQAVVIELSRAQVHVLNDVGAFIWERLQGRHSLPDLIAEMTEEFDVDAATASRDLDTFLEHLESLDLVAARA